MNVFQVSWIRKSDLHILTMVDVVYTGDDRYSISHANGSSDWVLNVRDAKVNDSGVYECQINTEPKRSKAYNLKVVGESTKNHSPLRGLPWLNFVLALNTQD